VPVSSPSALGASSTDTNGNRTNIFGQIILRLPGLMLWDVIVFNLFAPKKCEPMPSQFQTLGIHKSQSASTAMAVTEQMFVPS
jgi:hypothetical protein